MKLAAAIALAGGQTSPTNFTGPWKPFCDSPVPIHRYIRSGAKQHGLEVNMTGPCRKCPKCLEVRQRLWVKRAMNEIFHTASQNRRTWFVTLTLDPIHLAGILAEAAQRFEEPKRALEMAVHKHVARYIKRLRKGGARFVGDTKWNRENLRYFSVYERGAETGRSHVHLLVHELGPRPIANRHLKAAWRSNVDCKLVDPSHPGAAKYVTKYIGKDLTARPRASVRYGQRNAKSE